MMVFGIGLLFTGLFLGILGYAMDVAVETHLSIVAAAVIPAAQERVDTVHNVILMFRACAIMVPLGLGISYWANATREVPGEA